MNGSGVRSGQSNQRDSVRSKDLQEKSKSYSRFSQSNFSPSRNGSLMNAKTKKSKSMLNLASGWQGSRRLLDNAMNVDNGENEEEEEEEEENVESRHFETDTQENGEKNTWRGFYRGMANGNMGNGNMANGNMANNGMANGGMECNGMANDRASIGAADGGASNGFAANNSANGSNKTARPIIKTRPSCAPDNQHEDATKPKTNPRQSGRIKVKDQPIHDSHLLFEKLDEKAQKYKLRPFANRLTKEVDFGGFRDDGGIKFRKFSSSDEKNNFLSSHLGDTASPIDKRGYFVFGVRSYVRVEFCGTCRSNDFCGVDHHLQAVVSDYYANEAYYKTGIASTDLDMKKSFSLVHEICPVSGPANHDGLNKLASVLDNMSDHELMQMSENFFHESEIRYQTDGGFSFHPTENTANNALFVVMETIDAINDGDYDTAYTLLVSSNEPKDEASLFFFYLLFRQFERRQCKLLNPLFNDRRLAKIELSNFKFSKKEILPSGFLPAILRLSIEDTICRKLTSMVSHYQSKPNSEILVENGKISLKSYPGDIYRLVTPEFFPSMSDDHPSVLGCYLMDLLEIVCDDKEAMSKNNFTPSMADQALEVIKAEDMTFES